MLESLKELEKTIETFQNNVVASNELNDLLRGVIEQAKTTNESFDKASGDLLSKMDSVPETIRELNGENGTAIRENIETEIKGAVEAFKAAQQEYFEKLQGAQEEITGIMSKAGEQILESQKSAEAELAASRDAVKTELAASRDAVKTELEESRNAVREESGKFAEKAESLPAMITECNSEYAETLKTAVSAELQEMITSFKDEQAKYLAEIEKTQNQVAAYTEEMNSRFDAAMEKMNEITDSGILYVREELQEKLHSQTILIVVMALISIAVGLSRFFI